MPNSSPPLQHLEPGPQRALAGPAAGAVDRHLAGAGEEPLLRPALDPGAGEVVRLGHEGDPAVQRQRHENPVGEGEVVAGQDGGPVLGHVLRSLLDGRKIRLTAGPEDQVLQHPVDAPAAVPDPFSTATLPPGLDRDQIVVHAERLLRTTGGIGSARGPGAADAPGAASSRPSAVGLLHRARRTRRHRSGPVSSITAFMISSVTQRSTVAVVAGDPAYAAEVQRLADPDARAAHQRDLEQPGRHELGVDHADRDHRDPGLQHEPRDAGLALVEPAVG